MNEISTSSYGFEDIKHKDNANNEYWYARELMPLLEYKDWRNFLKVIKKAKESIKRGYQQETNHFVEVNKKIKIGSGTNKQTFRNIKDIKLSRYACYVIAQNGDPHKSSIASAQNYFAIQTRRQEIVDMQQQLSRRVQAREKLKETEKKFSNTLKDHGVSSQGIAQIRSAGDATLFGSPTATMKRKFGITQSKPLADHLPTITLKAKDLATEMTTHQTKQKQLFGQDLIKEEHVHNNSEIRKLLINNGIIPEDLPPEEDINVIKEKFQPDSVSDSTSLDIPSLTIDIRQINDAEWIKKLKKIIEENPGRTNLKIIYGPENQEKFVTRNINVNEEIYKFLYNHITK